MLKLREWIKSTSKYLGVDLLKFSPKVQKLNSFHKVDEMPRFDR